MDADSPVYTLLTIDHQHEVWRKTTENGSALTLLHAVAPPTLHKQREAHKLFKNYVSRMYTSVC